MRQPQRFEYHIEPVYNHHTAQAVLSDFAEQGWRLVAVTHPEQGQQFIDTASGGGQAKGPWLWLERPVEQPLVSPGMIRRTFSSVPSFIPVAGLGWTWYHFGEPMHRDGLYTVLGLGVVGAILMPGIVVSVEALPRLLVPSRIRIWWRHGQDHRPAIRVYLRRAVLAADRYCCCWCGETEGLQVDHIKPWASGGLSTLWNLAVLCGPCNRVKSNVWRTRGGFVYYKPFRNAGNRELALTILRYEKRHRWRPDRWLRAGWSLAA